MSVTDEMAKAITGRVKTFDWCSIVDAKRACQMKDLDVDGDLAMVLGTNPHVIMWLGMSNEFYDALKRCIGKSVFLWPGTVMAYAIDGEVPRLPVVSAARVETAKKDCWLPVMLRPMEMPDPVRKRR